MKSEKVNKIKITSRKQGKGHPKIDDSSTVADSTFKCGTHLWNDDTFFEKMVQSEHQEKTPIPVAPKASFGGVRSWRPGFFSMSKICFVEKI